MLVAAVLGAGAVHAADNPVAGLFPGHNTRTATVAVPAGTTRIGALNASGEGTFNLQNTGGRAMSSLLVAVDAGAPLKAVGYGCSTFSTLLTTCKADVVGNVVYLLFTGTPDIKIGAEFRLGFAPGTLAGPWPAGATVSVTPDGQIPPPRLPQAP
jgi:hypothetical protein